MKARIWMLSLTVSANATHHRCRVTRRSSRTSEPVSISRCCAGGDPGSALREAIVFQTAVAEGVYGAPFRPSRTEIYQQPMIANRPDTPTRKPNEQMVCLGLAREPAKFCWHLIPPLVDTAKDGDNQIKFPR